ncbi:MAG: polyhydroxyalkanoate synthesis repressor PhaR [Acetobacteraceae bacterium]|nr:polyhydroxyalkanoate synthesis repressor PhaR [Acetobacteraceae bacterium]
MSDPVHDEDTTRPSAPKPVVVKKYANRRLYNTESSSYITLENLAEMVRQGRDFIVFDAKTNEDITRSVLTQIIVEEEGKGSAMLPTGFLRQLIGMYGEDMQSLVPRYLEQAMSAFARQHAQVQVSVRQTIDTLIPPGLATGLSTGLGTGTGLGLGASATSVAGGLEEVGRQNLAMMERALNLFSPFYRPTASELAATAAPEETATPADASVYELANLRAEIALLRQELASSRSQTEKSRKTRANR